MCDPLLIDWNKNAANAAVSHRLFKEYIESTEKKHDFFFLHFCLGSGISSGDRGRDVAPFTAVTKSEVSATVPQVQAMQLALLPEVSECFDDTYEGSARIPTHSLTPPTV